MNLKHYLRICQVVQLFMRFVILVKLEQDYIIKAFNQTSLKLEGKSKEEVLGKSLYDLRPQY